MIFSLNPALFSVFHIFPVTQDKNPQCIFDSFLWGPKSNLKANPSKDMWGGRGKLGFSPASSLSLAQQPEETSAQFSGSVVSDSLWPHGLQHTRPPCPWPAPGVHSNHVHWVGDAIQPSLSLSSPSLPTADLSQHQGLFKWVSSSHQVPKVLEFQVHH